MLNFGAKKEALARLSHAAQRHAVAVDETTTAAVQLHVLRSQVANDLVAAVEALVSRLANSPREFDKTVSEFHVEADKFRGLVGGLEVEYRGPQRVAGGVAAGGVAAGVGVAAFGPAAAMAVATTFGTASTGTAISALSGAAATNAALAWLGGGAVAAGGGGMAGGQAFLALAGPVGWALGGLALAGAAGYTHARNGKIAHRATTEAVRVEGETWSLQVARNEISRLIGLTQEHAAGAAWQLEQLASSPRDYAGYSVEEKERLAALINNVRSLGKLLNQQVA